MPLGMIEGLRVRWRGLRKALNEARPYLIALVVAAVLISSWWLPFGEFVFRVKTTGFLFQLFGLLTVVLGLSEARRLFGQPTLSMGGARWARQLGRGLVLGPPLISGSAHQTLPGLGQGGKVKNCGRREPRENGQQGLIEARLKDLEEDTAVLEQRLSAVDKSVARQIEDEAQSRQHQDELTRRQLEEAAIGGMHLELVGLGFLLFGMLLATFPQGIAEGINAVILG